MRIRKQYQLCKIKLGNTIICRIMPGVRVKTSLKQILTAQDIKRAVILSAIGSLAKVSFYGVKRNAKLPFSINKKTYIKKKGPFEILSLEGNIIPEGGKISMHLHVILSTSNGNVIGGHLEDGIVYTTIEIFIANISCKNVIREKDKVIGGSQIIIK